MLGNFQVLGWRNHGGSIVDQQYIWWHSKNAGAEKTAIALNFGRVKDPIIDDLLDKARVESDPAERTAMLDCISTNETSFFREPKQFELLDAIVLPHWRALGESGAIPKRIRAWSAACCR